MAGLSKKNKAMLASIGSGAVTHISKDDGMPLLEAGVVTVDTTQLDAAGNAYVALTDAGKSMVNGSAVSAPTSSGFEVMNVGLPPSKRKGRGGGGAPVKYPFDQLEIGQTFFVPASEKMPDPVKTLQSTVSSANMRYAVDTGEKKTVTRNKRGKKNKLVLDAAGNPIPETVEVTVYRHTRKFSLRPIDAGVDYNGWVAPANGALIGRV